MRSIFVDHLVGADVEHIDVLRENVEPLPIGRRSKERGKKRSFNLRGEGKTVEDPVGFEIVAHHVDGLGEKTVHLHPDGFDGDVEHLPRGVRRRAVHSHSSLGGRELDLVHHGARGDVHDLHRLHPVGDEEITAKIRGAIGAEDVGDGTVAELHFAHHRLRRLVEEPEPVGPDADEKNSGLGRGRE